MSGLRALIIDDDEDTRESMAMLVRMWGHEPYLAEDFVAALEANKKYRPHVVLLDIHLPGKNGWEIARLLREQGEKGLFLIAVTGFGRAIDQARSREAGFDAHLTKPADPAEVKRLLDDLARSYESAKQETCFAA